MAKHKPPQKNRWFSRLVVRQNLGTLRTPASAVWGVVAKSRPPAAPIT
jgi:hypothetical protein